MNEELRIKAEECYSTDEQRAAMAERSAAAREKKAGGE